MITDNSANIIVNAANLTKVLDGTTTADLLKATKGCFGQLEVEEITYKYKNINVNDGDLDIGGNLDVSGTLDVDAFHANVTTDMLGEGSANQYFTNARAIGAFTPTNITITAAGQISIPQSVDTAATPTFGGLVSTGHFQAVDISGANLDLTGDFNVAGVSEFTGDISANDISGANLDLTGDFNVTGASEFTGDISANDISGANLDLTGDFNVVGDISGNGDFIVGGDVSFFGVAAHGQAIPWYGARAQHSVGSGVTINVNDTFDGYTIGQVVKALKDYGLLA